MSSLQLLQRSGGRLAAEISRTHGAGHGVIATRAVSPGEVLLRVPRALWLPSSAAAAREAAGRAAAVRMDCAVEALGGAATQLADAALLAAQVAADVKREAAAYVEELPAALDLPLLWRAELRAVLLQGTSCYAACQRQVEVSDALYDALDGRSAWSAGDLLSKAEFRWGQALLLSRAHSGAGKPFALVPLLDFLNHAGSAAGASVRFAPADEAFELVAEREHAAGEELFIDYGVRGSHVLLRKYGFVMGGGGEASVSPAHEAAAAIDEEVLLRVGSPAGGDTQRDAADASPGDRRPAKAPSALVLRMRWETPPSGTTRGQVALPLPQLDTAAGVRAAEAIGVALEQRLDEHLPGYEACKAVLQMPDDSLGDVSAKRRARLCQQLHEREMKLLATAREQIIEALRSR
ncbi:hypothetical protein AB1Y20_004210 [Prymnesium parvum]|uniref:SET domain-containing protein n=1 Tax=Prymnesium parvum TaxID=97485 RepID=A0AB34J720_PRYPA